MFRDGLLILYLVVPMALGQALEAQVLEEGTLEEELIFADDLFTDAFDIIEDIDSSSWRDGLTIRLSQQISGQVNHHLVEPLPGYLLSKHGDLENNRFGINLRYQNAFALGWLLQGSWQARAYWPGDYEYTANNDNLDAEYRVNELFVQRSLDQQSLKLGRQTVVWGETVGNSVLDVINHTEYRDFGTIDIEDARLNQWMLVWDVFKDSGNWSSFINLYPEFNPQPVVGSPFYVPLPYELNDYIRSDKTLFEVGTQWSKSFEGSDIALMAAYLYENQLRYPQANPQPIDFVALTNDFVLLGLSANRAIGKLLLSADIALSHGLLLDESTLSGGGGFGLASDIKKDQIALSLGFEYGISNLQSLSVSIQAKRMLDERDGLADEQQLINKGVYGSWLVRYSNQVMNDNLGLSATLQGDLEGDTGLLFLGADYSVNDRWQVAGQIISIISKKNSPLAIFDQDLRLGLIVTYAF
jgi:hypothetical protein|tara:strand:- start:4610 stop:6019 length:1410 start_codon:yes stop_codon:yes gene_type:complete